MKTSENKKCELIEQQIAQLEQQIPTVKQALLSAAESYDLGTSAGILSWAMKLHDLDTKIMTLKAIAKVN